VNGWSEFSDTSYIYAFAVPEKPPAPVYTEGTDTTVTLKFMPSRNDHGIRVTSYELYIDAGDDTTSSFRQLPSYSTFKSEHTLDRDVDLLGDPGTIYRAKILAVNEEGLKSESSNECLFALGALPSQPNQVRKDSIRSSGEAIFVEWDKITTDTLMVLGYKLYADSGRNEPLHLVYDGSNNPQISEFSFEKASNLNETINNKLWYRFQVAAVNFNGEGERSETLSLQCCTMPAQLQSPSVYEVNS
jgi:hypothetical protein